ncbi:hypothetical protein WA026_005777 [Henosepilachna vigintioctopunctata]|uniref:Uncharacterized protein n=1 Tax=Henosepilachna vigintioctopunctata TaxID=420089 RepID=A0AAW1TTV0_9CUCU
MFRSKKKKGLIKDQIPTIVVNSPSDEFKMSETSIDDEKNDEEVNKREGLKGGFSRRNSISLPNLDDMQIIKTQVAQAENDIVREAFNSDNESSESEDIEFKVPLRNARRKSVINPRMLRATGDEESPANSITSINSLASLLREKMQMFPATLKKKKSPDYKIRIFVGLLFIAIVFLVSFAYALYHQKVLQRAYFDRIKFNHVKRIMKIFNNEGQEVIHARLGTSWNADAVHPCLPRDQIEGSICLEWMQKARLYLTSYELESTVKCYNLKWTALADNDELTDCFIFSGNEHWYGGGQNSESALLLEKRHHPFSPFITGRVDKHEWGNILKRYFISSKGAAILVDNTTPLYTSVSVTDKKQLCLKAKYDDFAFVNRVTQHPHLNYNICTSSNTTQLHSNLIENTLWDGLKQEDLVVINSLLTEPLWEITSAPGELTEEIVNNYTTDVISLGFLKQGHVLINEFWQKQVGDFTVDLERFPKFEKDIDIMHRRGFRIVFSIQPFISTESFNFAEAVRKRLLVSERLSDREIPALTKYKSLRSAGMLDPTNNETIPWLLEKLKSVSGKYKFDSFYLDVGVAYDMPHYYQCDKALINPDYYKTLLTNSLQYSVNLFGVNSATERPKAPTFVSLPQFESSWEGLRRVIPTILSYGLIGFPFLIPGAVGGDFETNYTMGNATNKLLPDTELYIRWLQLATFLPVIRFTHLPSTYGDHNVLEMTKFSSSLRQMKVSPLLKKYARIALDTGFPIVRPLWMMDSNDPSCHSVVDEFSIGDDLIVAPVLYSGARQREVYLPAGVWKDGIDGSYRKGSRWIHNYKVEENEVAYFEKMPDSTRL